MPEKTMTRECGCKMHYTEDATGYVTRYECIADVPLPESVTVEGKVAE